MQVYKQTDDAWKDIPLGESPYRMGTPGVGFGCTTTCVAQMLTLAGWNLTPGDVVTKLNSEHGYTNAQYSAGPGLLYWRTPGVEYSFPQFHFNNGGPFHFWVGRFGVYQHWVTEYQGVFYEPITGGTYHSVQEVQAACGVKDLTMSYSATIDAPPVIDTTIKRATVTATGGLYLRTSPHVLADNYSLLNGKADIIQKGGPCDWDTTVEGDTVDGSNVWLHKPDGLYVWAGGTNYNK